MIFRKFCAALAAALCVCSLVQHTSVSAQETLGDPDGSGVVDASDAAVVLVAAARLGATGSDGLTGSQRAASDVNADGTTDASDAAVILSFSAYAGSGGRLAFGEFLSADIRYVDAVYLGVKDWGKSATKLANAQNFQYRFQVDGAEQLYTIDSTARDETGAYAYPIQNLLKEQYPFRVTLENGTVVAVKELPTEAPEYTPPVSGTPGVRTLKNFLRTAMEPVGTTLYVFGGAWNWQDTGSGWSSRKIGVSPDWVRFYREQDMTYTYRDKDGNTSKPDPPNSYYPYGGFNEYHYAGLDCSGFVSWAVYNTLHDSDDLPGYGGKSTQMARRFAGYGWGSWTHSVPKPTGTAATAMKPGDIMSKSGHVWISLGTCPDGSIVIAHSTPSYSHQGQPGGGVQIGAVGTSESCQAYKLAETYMSKYYPDWCSRYPVTLQSTSYLATAAADCGRFRWDTQNFLTDPEGLQEMSAADALAVIFGEK
ncbi:MAG: hypothetical protein II916_03280 [Oscillospiraceae bacterium]|nr:hypothetical protein [Oscillospiraceae bacterium]